MNKLTTTFFIKMLTLLVMCGALSSCQDKMPYRETIISGSNKAPTTPDTRLVRPDNAIKYKTDFCGCKDTKAVTYGNCANFCSSKNTGGLERFYADFTVTEKISLSSLGNVHGWCTTVFETDTENPKCVIQAKDEEGNIREMDAITTPNSNKITANMEGLSYDKTYVLTLVETKSGAKSDSIQIIKFYQDIALGSLGPIKNSPVSQYTCLVRAFSPSSAGEIFYESAYRLHFYFLPRIGVSPIPANQTDLICHDIFNPMYGAIDDASYPRLEEIPGIFNLWDTLDPRFYDNDSNGIKDINEIIAQKVKNFGGGTISTATSYFNEFKWFGSPQVNSSAGNTNSEQTIGYYMAPWINPTTYKSFCLTSVEYNGMNPLFKAFRDIIGVDTEGLYVGEKAPEAITTPTGLVSGQKDFILIRETDIKAVWFYLNNGVLTAPTDNNVKDVSVYFYYPLNKTTPFVKTSSQKMYKVKWAYELTPTGSSTPPSSLPPHDRKIGCIPKF